MKTKREIVYTMELRSKLKELFQDEINKVPEYLQQLEAKDKLDYLIKLMPYVLPKVENIKHGYGEPLDFDWS